jgi:glyoxylate reductase
MYDVIAIPPLPREARSLLRDHNVNVLYLKKDERDALLNSLAEGVKVLLIVGLRVDEALLSRARGLKLVITRTSGLDGIDIDSANRYGVCVANEPEVIDEAVAEHVIGGVIAALKYVVAGHEYVVNGEWFSRGWPAHYRGGLIVGRRLGLLGGGRIATLVAVKAKSLGVSRVMYWSRTRKPDLEMAVNAQRLPMDELFTHSDILVNTLPYAEGTRHIVTYEYLMKLPKGAVFVNVGRGITVEKDAIIKALETRKDLRFVLDVHYKEPVAPESELIKKYGRDPRVVLTPHIAGYTEESYRGTALLVAVQALKFLTEGCVWNPANESCRQCPDSPPPINDILPRIARYVSD